MSQKIKCAEHGTVEWDGEVVCSRCHSLWKLMNSDHHPPDEYDQNCVCGALLVGPNGTARPICADCYKEGLRKQMN